MSPLTAGTVYTGIVTQSGSMTDGRYRYDAIQACTLTVKSFDNCTVVCEIKRVENQKFIDGHSIPLPAWPEYLIKYLTTWGNAVERAIGTYDPCTGLLLLQGEEPVVTVDSWVQWSRHAYALLVDEKGIKGLAFDLEEGANRVSEVGRLRVVKNDGSTPRC